MISYGDPVSTKTSMEKTTIPSRYSIFRAVKFRLSNASVFSLTEFCDVVLSKDSKVWNRFKMYLKQLKFKANEFINNKKCSNELLDIMEHFNVSAGPVFSTKHCWGYVRFVWIYNFSLFFPQKECIVRKSPVTPCLLTLEQIFMELISRRDMYVNVQPLKSTIGKSEIKNVFVNDWPQNKWNVRMRQITRFPF